MIPSRVHNSSPKPPLTSICHTYTPWCFRRRHWKHSYQFFRYFSYCSFTLSIISYKPASKSFSRYSCTISSKFPSVTSSEKSITHSEISASLSIKSRLSIRNVSVSSVSALSMTFLSRSEISLGCEAGRKFIRARCYRWCLPCRQRCRSSCHWFHIYFLKKPKRNAAG